MRVARNVGVATARYPPLAGYRGGEVIATRVSRHARLEEPLSIILGYDPVTLREKVDTVAANARLDEIADLRSLSALAERTSLLRLLGRLDEAFDIANEALRLTRFTGDRKDYAAARLRRAQVLQFQGKFVEAESEMTAVAADASIHEWTRIEAFARQHRGKVHFDSGDLEAALMDFKAAVFLREKHGAPADQMEASLTSVLVVESLLAERVTEDLDATRPLAGWRELRA